MKFVTAAAAIAMTLASCGNTAKQNASSSVKSEVAAKADEKNKAVLKTSMWIANYASTTLNVYLGDGERSKMNNAANCLAVGEIKGSIDMLLPLLGQAPILELDDIKKLQADAKNLSVKCDLVGMQTEQDLVEGAKALHSSLTAFTAKLYQTPG